MLEVPLKEGLGELDAEIRLNRPRAISLRNFILYY
jgi:hypothetical protein